ncbi:unnamed protein product [Blepharisma stoltei]|uniref:Uncharacterized protein n=1 Tax=Blepharisma stoltei TaxID=1481888 RepID=A0AAU9IG24_9CILI|nr:unnamed protein product [Blepharisma stoltei]
MACEKLVSLISCLPSSIWTSWCSKISEILVTDLRVVCLDLIDFISPVELCLGRSTEVLLNLRAEGDDSSYTANERLILGLDLLRDLGDIFAR